MNVRIAQLVSITAGSWYDDTLEMNQYTIKLWMITQTASEQEQNIAFRRMKHLGCYELDSTIFIDEIKQEKCVELTRTGLNVTPLPGIASEQLIGIMLFHKLNAIMEGRIEVVEIEISAGDGVVYLHGENETSTDIKQPDWWSSADLTHSDIVNNTENIVNLRPVTTWRDLDLSWPDIDEDNHGNTIVFANFKAGDDTK